MSRPIRVLLQLDRLGLGGLEKKVTQLALRLDRKRFEPIVAYSSEWGVYGDELQRAGVPVVKIVPEPAWSSGVVKATRQIREIAPHICHTFSCRENADDVYVAHRAKVPVIITARDNVRHWAPTGPVKQWECERNAMAAFVTPCCEAAANLCRSLEGIRPECIVTIYNGVEQPIPSGKPSIREELGLPAGTFLAGYAARYESLKGHETIVSALGRIAARHPEIHLVCCGDFDGDRIEKVRRSVAEHCLEGQVTLLGQRLDMDSFYRGLDLYLHASLSEAFSMSILESMSYGLAVAAFAVGGTPEAVVQNETGTLAACGDAGGLAEDVIRLMEAPAERQRMGAAGLRRVRERFSVDRMVQAYEDLYVRAVEGSALNDAVVPERPTWTGTAASALLEDTTVFVTTIGDEANLADCLDHLRAQSVRCRIEMIDRVAPMSAAFARMHQQCTTPYYVQVDEDMILQEKAIEKLHDLLAQAPPDVALVCAPLWDCDVERAILGVKIYRHAVVKKFPYENTLSCEVKQLEQMRAAGYRAELLSTEEDAVCVGEHGKHYTPESIFRRWQRNFHKHNRLGNMVWLEPWPKRLLERYISTRDPVHLYAMLGAIAGIAGQANGNRELDWRDIDPALQRLRYYFPFDSDAEE